MFDNVRGDRSSSGAQRGAGALQQVREPALQLPAGAADGPDAEPPLRELPGEQVPQRRRARQPGAHGPGLARALRQPVLPQPPGRRRPAGLRPAALRRRPHAPRGGLAGQQHRRLPPCLRRRRRQARPRRGQVRRAGQHPQTVRRVQLTEGGKRLRLHAYVCTRTNLRVHVDMHCYGRGRGEYFFVLFCL
jgi:hypothetical protein